MPGPTSLFFQGSAREQQAGARICGRRLLDDQDVTVIEARIDADRAARQMAAAHAALSDPLRGVLDLVALDGLTVREERRRWAAGGLPGRSRGGPHDLPPVGVVPMTLPRQSAGDGTAGAG